MQASEVKPLIEQRALVAERTPAAAKEEASCCAAVPAEQARLRPWLIGGAVLAALLLLIYGGWDWLVAAGLSTFVIAMAPCLAMCALGFCIRGGSKDESSLAQNRKTYAARPGEPPSRS